MTQEEETPQQEQDVRFKYQVRRRFKQRDSFQHPIKVGDIVNAKAISSNDVYQARVCDP